MRNWPFRRLCAWKSSGISGNTVTNFCIEDRRKSQAASNCVWESIRPGVANGVRVPTMVGESLAMLVTPPRSVGKVLSAFSWPLPSEAHCRAQICGKNFATEPRRSAFRHLRLPNTNRNVIQHRKTLVSCCAEKRFRGKAQARPRAQTAGKERCGASLEHCPRVDFRADWSNLQKCISSKA